MKVPRVDGHPFGDEGLLAAVDRARDGRSSARHIRESVLDALSRHKRDAPQHDDITLVVAKVGEMAVTAGPEAPR